MADPRCVNDLRSFLDLAWYYRKFIRNNAGISKDLTDLLKKGIFKWSDKAQSSFETLKNALVFAPVLDLQDFTKVLVLETDASKDGFHYIIYGML